MIQVYLVDCSVKREFLTFNTKQEAFDFCQKNGWCWEDENGFVWDLWFEGHEEI